MRIGITAYHLLQPGGGIKEYVRGLVTALAGLDPALELVLVFPYSASRRDGAPRFREKNISSCWLPGPTRLLRASWRRFGRPRLERFTGPLDVVHGTHFLLPPARTDQLVLTVHDLAPLRHPGAFDRGILEGEEYARLLPDALKRASRVITPSESTARDLVELRGVPRERITVIPYGLDAAPWKVDPAEAEATVRKELGIGGEFLFHNVGTMKPTKNLQCAVEAFGEVRKKTGRDILLVMAAVGEVAPGVREAIRRLGLESKIRFLQGASRRQLASLYTACSAALYVSLYEGFGLPALEALAAGAPLVASRASSVPEVVGEAALLVDPESVAEIAGAVERLLSDEKLNHRLRGDGPRRAAGYSWDAAARSTMEVYTEVMDN